MGGLPWPRPWPLREAESWRASLQLVLVSKRRAVLSQFPGGRPGLGHALTPPGPALPATPEPAAGAVPLFLCQRPPLLSGNRCRRAFFRSQVKDSESQSQYGSLRWVLGPGGQAGVPWKRVNTGDRGVQKRGGGATNGWPLAWPGAGGKGLAGLAGGYACVPMPVTASDTDPQAARAAGARV